MCAHLAEEGGKGGNRKGDEGMKTGTVGVGQEGRGRGIGRER